MIASIRAITCDPDPIRLPADPERFMFLASLECGPEGEPGSETFDLTVCSAEWLAASCRRSGGIYDPRHHLVVDIDQFDIRALRRWLEQRVRRAHGTTWTEIAQQLTTLGAGEFDR